MIETKVHGRPLGAYVVGDLKKHHMESFVDANRVEQKAWSMPRLGAIAASSSGRMHLHMHDLRREAGSRLLERGEAAKWEQDLAELRTNLPQGHNKDHKLIKSVASVGSERA